MKLNRIFCRCFVREATDCIESESHCMMLRGYFSFSFVGVCHSKPALVAGGRIFVWPLIQKLQK